MVRLKLKYVRDLKFLPVFGHWKVINVVVFVFFVASVVFVFVFVSVVALVFF